MGVKLFSILVFLSGAFATASTVVQNGALSYVAIGVLFWVIIASNAERCFTAIVATSTFAPLFSISGIGVYFLATIIAAFKMMRAGRNASMWFAAIAMLAIYVLHDIQVTTMGTILNQTCYLLFFFIACLSMNFRRYDHRLTVVLFLCSVILNYIGSIALTGDLSQLGDESIQDVRLGEGDIEGGQNNNLGGAMGFPILTIYLITFGLPLLLGNYLRTTKKIILALVLLICFVVTFFSTSKVYLLGLATLAVCLFFYFFRGGASFKEKSGATLFVFFAFVVLYYSGYLDLFISRYEYRMGDGDMDRLTTGRSLIIASCLDYLANHPLAILIGEGYRRYISIGATLQLPFSMSAHNVILDCIMAYGVFGVVVIISSLRALHKKIVRLFCDYVPSALGWAPLICWISMCMSNSPFMLPKTYVILPFLVLHIYYYRSLMKNEK